MKKILIILAAVLCTMSVCAQEYTVISRDNDVIKLFPNALGKGLKSILPGGAGEPEYRLIKKVENGKESLLYVDFSKSIEKVFVTYETDMVHPGEWDVKIYTAVDIYKCLKRVNAILLKGELLGMPIEVYQRPFNFQDRISIDSVEFPMPIKVDILEGSKELAGYVKANQPAQTSTQAPKPAEPEEVIPDIKAPTNEAEQRDANDHYIAYLVKSRTFNHSSDAALLEELCDNAHVAELLHNHGVNYLQAMGKYHDVRLEVCILK